jgi:hypothetical protein
MEAEDVYGDEQFVVVKEGVVKERVSDGFLAEDQLVQEEETEKIYESTSVASIDDEAKVHMTELTELEKSKIKHTFIPEITTMKMEANKLDTDVNLAQIGVYAPEEAMSPKITEEQEFREFIESGQGDKPIDEFGFLKMTDAEHDHFVTEVTEVPVAIEKGVFTIQTLESPTKEVVTQNEALSQASAYVGIAQKDEDYEFGVIHPEIERTDAVKSIVTEISPELICDDIVDGKDSVEDVVDIDLKCTAKDVCVIR